MTGLRECEIMNQICSSIVRKDWHIKFVCILVQNGKLIVGHGRSCILSINTSKSDKSTISIPDNLPNITYSNIEELVEAFLEPKNMYLFYSDYLL